MGILHVTKSRVGNIILHDSGCHFLVRGGIPAHRSHAFTTSRDDQTSVMIRVLQGESSRSGDNHLLGEFVLSDIPPAPKGEAEIEVTFDIDASGIVNVSARDRASGSARAVTVQTSGTLSEAELEQLVIEHASSGLPAEA